MTTIVVGFALVAALALGAATAFNLWGEPPPSVRAATHAVVGSWRDGFKAANETALTFQSWEALWDWADSGSRSLVMPVISARSTDLAGGRHSYVDTSSAGSRDACIGILEEMRFIKMANSGDTARLFEIMRGWMRSQDWDEIIPPGHF